MIKFMKKNKLFSILIIVTTVVFFLGMIFSILLDSSIKNIVYENMNTYLEEIRNHSYSFSSLFYSSFSRIYLFIGCIWIFGISIIGIIVSFSFYLIEIFLFSMESFYYLSKISSLSIVFIILTLLPKMIQLLLYFFLVYYSSSFSLILFRLLFLKKNFPLKSIFKRYLVILLIVSICSLFLIILDSFITVKILMYFI